MTALSGADLIMSIHPKNQTLLLEPGVPRKECIDDPVDKSVLARLMDIPDFVQAYEPEGMKPEKFITYGVTQRTLTQFSHAGWLRLEKYKI